MKLARVNLARAMSIGRHHIADLNAEANGDLEANFDQRVVWIGDQFIPFEAINTATKAESDVPCPECQKKFTNLQALGAHRNKAHGVRGGGGEAA